MPLTDIQIRNAKATEKRFRLSDGDGLFLQVEPSGRKLWRFRYRYDGKEKMISLGKYPEITLSRARERLLEARREVAEGIDPSEARKASKRARVIAEALTFEAVATEYLEKLDKEGLAAATLKKRRSQLKNLSPSLAPRPISDISAQELLLVLRQVEAKGAHTAAVEARSLCSRIWQFAVSTGRADRNVPDDLKGALVSPKVTHRSGVTKPAELGQLMKALQSRQHSMVICAALELLAHTFVRPGELRKASWSEVDLPNALWRIPADRMKMKRDHLVPLSERSIELFGELRAYAGNSPLVLPSPRDPMKPYSDPVFNKTLRALGFGPEKHVAHGFRSTASTLLNEQSFPSDWIERQLAHVEGNKVRSAYNAAEHIEGRTRMMNEWSAFLLQHAN